MGLALPVFNLTFGKGPFPYQDVMRHHLIHRNAGGQDRSLRRATLHIICLRMIFSENRSPLFRIMRYNMPSTRGSHSETSGT
jgi:hypothetical protein